MDNGNDRLPFDPGEERLDVINENLSLISRKRGLTFGTDSYLLAAFAKAVPSGRAAELGCGTAVASLLCAQKGKYSFVTAAEIQEKYADLARRNVELNGLKDKIAVVRADVRDLTEKDTGGPCDAVFANPPYMKSGAGKANDEEEMTVARREIFGGAEDFCGAAARLLKYGGSFSVVYRPDRTADLFCAMRGAGIEPKKMVAVYPYVDAPPCLILVEGRRGGAPGITVSRPLIIYSEHGRTDYTDDMAKIYEGFTFEHLIG